MKKLISSLVILAMFSNVASAQVVKNTTVASQKAVVDDFDDADDIVKSSAPTTYKDVKSVSDAKDAKMFLKQQEKIPDNIKQNYEEKKDGYLLEGFQLGVGIGILGGANAQLGYRIPQRNYNFWKNRFGFRVDYNSWKPLKKRIEEYMEDNPIELDGTNFSAMFDGTNYGLLVDFYPFGNTWALGNFRISGGYYTGDFKIDAVYFKMGSLDKIEMGGLVYAGDAEALLHTRLNADVKGPYAGVGFDFALLFGLKFYFDAGVVFTNHPKIDTDIELVDGEIKIFNKGDNVNTATPLGTVDMNNFANNSHITRLLNDTKKEFEDSDEVKLVTDANIFPMVKLGLMLRF